MSDWYQDYLHSVADDPVANEGERFDWDAGNLDHIAHHRVSKDEAEEALLDRRGFGRLPGGWDDPAEQVTPLGGQGRRAG